MIGRVLLGVLIGAVLSYWALFLYLILGVSGVVYATGVTNEGFEPAYFASLYVPPILAIVLGYFALRQKGRNA